VEDQVVGRWSKQLELMDSRRNMLWMVESCRTGSELQLCKQLMGFTPDSNGPEAKFWGNQLLQKLISRLEVHVSSLEDHLLQDLSECEAVIKQIEEGVFKVGGTD
jgi:hypothetical protein